MAIRINDDNRGVGGGQGINDASKGSETTMEAARIRKQRQRMRRIDDGLEEMATTTEVLAEKDDT